MKVRLAVLVLIVAACTTPTTTPSPSTTSASPSPTAAAGTELVVMTHDSFAVSDQVKQEFEQQNGVTVKILKSGDAGVMVNQAILAKDAPLADVLYGVDNTFLSRALDAGIFEPYVSPGLASVSSAFQLDPESRATPIDYGDVCLNYDTTVFGGDLPRAPLLLSDLTDPAYKDKLVVENPATSSPGLAFVLATVAEFGDAQAGSTGPTPDGETWQSYWQRLRDNGVLVSNDWNDAYYNQFSGGAGEGDRPIVVSYATSPAAEVVLAETRPPFPPTANVSHGCFRQVEFAAVLANGRPEARPLVQKWIDFMLSKRFQEDMPLNMFVLPVIADAEVPMIFKQTGAHIFDPFTMSLGEISALRDRVIQEWTDIVLR
jgi:thiamine transport system substrate-binding protein